MIGKPGGPGGSMADRVEFRRNLTMVKINKHGRIKQKGNNRFSETICIFVFSADKKLHKSCLLYTHSVPKRSIF